MATATWKAGSGDWTTAADWDNGTVPDATTDVTVAPPGPSTISIDSSIAVHSILLNSSSATITDTGTLTLPGADATLIVNAGVLRLGSGGKIVGGIVSATGGNIDCTSGTLSGVTIGGAFIVAGGSPVYFENGLNGLAPGGATIQAGSASNYGALVFDDTQTVDDLTINLGLSGGDAGAIGGRDTDGKGAKVLTLGSAETIDGSGGIGRG